MKDSPEQHEGLRGALCRNAPLLEGLCERLRAAATGGGGMSPPQRSGAGPGFAQGSNDHSLPVLWETAKNLNSRGASPRARAPGSGPTRLTVLPTGGASDPGESIFPPPLQPGALRGPRG